MEAIFGFLVMILGLVEAYFTHAYFHGIKTNGGPSTSPFAAYSVWYSLFIAILLFFGGIYLMIF